MTAAEFAGGRFPCAAMAAFLCAAPWLAATAAPSRVADIGRESIGITVDAEPAQVDSGRDFFVTVAISAPRGTVAALPDLRDRFTGFSVAEDFAEDPVETADGSTVSLSRWRLVPEPVASRYRLAPFVVEYATTNAAGETVSRSSFCTSAVYFAPPPPREAVTGGMEIDPRKDLPPPSWRLAGLCALALAALAAAVAGLWWGVRKIREAFRVHRMSPIQRAYYELGRLLEKNLPGRGLYKDFYVELTMVVRRYIERRYGVKAPNMTTQEFLGELARREGAVQGECTQIRDPAALKEFLESADLVKFAGLEATPEMAGSATGKARGYLASEK